MTPDDVLDEPLDRPGSTRQQLPRTRSQREPDAYPGRDGREPRRPALWNATAARDYPTPVWGMLPRGFLAFAHEELGRPPHRRYLHVCSGGITPDECGWRVDVAMRAAPDVLADGCSLPFRDECLDAVLIDPPYTKQYAEALYGVEYARPSHLLSEAARVLAPGGAIGFVHFLVPHPPLSATW